MKPARSILDPLFRYTPSVQTDIRKTFAKARRRMTQEKQDEQERQSKVMPIKRSKA